MATKKEYGLVFEDMSVKIAEIIIVESSNNPQCLNKLNAKLQSILDKNKYEPISIIPDSAYYSVNMAECVLRNADFLERDEYLSAYHNDIEFYDGTLYNSKIV